MQTQIITYTAEGKKVVGWLHRATKNPKTLVIVSHGHNSNGTKPRFLELTNAIQRRGVDCVRWSVTRKEVLPGVKEVTTATEEVNQVRTIVDKLRPKYDIIVLAGHSQGGLQGLRLLEEGVIDASIQLMANYDTQYSVKTKLERIKKTIETFAEDEIIPRTSEEDGSFGYTKAYFDDLLQWNVKKMLKKIHKPLLFVEATNDDKLREGEVKDAYEQANSPKELFTVIDTHSFTEETAIEIAKKTILWLQDNQLLK